MAVRILRRRKSRSTFCELSNVHTRARICDLGLYAASAIGLPEESLTSSVSPALPLAFSTAPEKIHGWRRLSDFSRPFLSWITERVPSLLLRPWMRRVVDLRQRLVVEVSVDLRGRDAGMAEHLLHRAQILRGLQHVGGEGVAQHVRVHALAQAAALRPAPEPHAHGGRRDAPAARADEQRLLARRRVAHREP